MPWVGTSHTVRVYLIHQETTANVGQSEYKAYHARTDIHLAISGADTGFRKGGGGGGGGQGNC